jgi:hypothetical protein
MYMYVVPPGATGTTYWYMRANMRIENNWLYTPAAGQPMHFSFRLVINFLTVVHGR